MHAILTSLRIVIATMLVCVVAYAGLILAAAQTFAPERADGSLVARPGTDSGGGGGAIVGSRLIAQKFERPEYFWPRPSAADFNGAGAGGSNKSPTSADLTARAEGVIERYGATSENPIPAELGTASGSGLDPHISLRAAMYQAERVARARGVPRAQLDALIRTHSFAPGGFLAPGRLVNVLELNIALDASPEAGS